MSIEIKVPAEMQGTTKQVYVAMNIRARAVKAVLDHCTRIALFTPEVAAKIERVLNEKRAATWWIENRTQIVRAIMTLCR